MGAVRLAIGGLSDWTLSAPDAILPSGGGSAGRRRGWGQRGTTLPFLRLHSQTWIALAAASLVVLWLNYSWYPQHVTIVELPSLHTAEFHTTEKDTQARGWPVAFEICGEKIEWGYVALNTLTALVLLLAVAALVETLLLRCNLVKDFELETAERLGTIECDSQRTKKVEHCVVRWLASSIPDEQIIERLEAAGLLRWQAAELILRVASERRATIERRYRNALRWWPARRIALVLTLIFAAASADMRALMLCLLLTISVFSKRRPKQPALPLHHAIPEIRYGDS